ncbi:MAG: flagellar motor switch protein FliM [Thermodesulfobacteriota bacterium]|nr:flagellar motor switch protein FliM [Thermodesulfobacteriota bacterium]
MSEILSQDEVDSLLSGLSEGKVKSETDKTPVDGEIVPYDFSNQSRLIIRDRMPTFDVINQRLGRNLRVSMSNMLHTSLDINPEGVNTVKFYEFIRSLPVPTSLHVFRMEPLRGHSLLVLESRLVFNLIDKFFGGTGGGATKIEGREFTSIENIMIKRIVTTCLDDLEEAWKPVKSVQPSLVRSEVNPQFAAVVLPEDMVIVIKYEVEMDQAVGKIILCMPYAMIEPIRSILSSGFQAETLDIDYHWQRRLKEIIFGAEVECTVELGSTEISGERLLKLQTGDVIQLDQDAGAKIRAYVEGVPKLNGFPGVHRGFQALKL